MTDQTRDRPAEASEPATKFVADRDLMDGREDRTRRSGGKPLRASPFSWETAPRVRAPWRR